MKGLLVVTKRELRKILNDAGLEDTAQFTIEIEKQQDYWHIRED